MTKAILIKITATILLLVVALLVIFTLIDFIANSNNELDERIGELENIGYNVKDCPMTFSELKEDRIAESNAVFVRCPTWFEFTEKVNTVKDNLGFVTVWLCRDDSIFWVHATETTYYYYQID